MVMACVEVTDTTAAIAVGNLKGARPPFFPLGNQKPAFSEPAPSPLIVRMIVPNPHGRLFASPLQSSTVGTEVGEASRRGWRLRGTETHNATKLNDA
jgi:hypothetical protein